jgi:cytochrome c oxidase assembly protein subunit 15
VLACGTFLLVSVGGTVTTYDAGMSVRDWPTTEGDWFYPVPQWLAADWDVFWEHGHRMLAQGVGVIVIALVVALWKLDGRRWMRWLGVVALAGVIFQGVLGGLRVLEDRLLLAEVHGCTAPLFFALCAALVTLTSGRWQGPGRPENHPAARHLHRLTLAISVALYLEIVFGAQLRHVPPERLPGWSVVWVWLKLIAAGLIATTMVWLLIYVLRRAKAQVMIVRRAKLLAGLFFVQLVLGAGTWVTNFGWPAWFRDYLGAMSYTVVAGGPLQGVTTTAHAAMGSLNLVAAMSLMLWSRRLLCGPSR